VFPQITKQLDGLGKLKKHVPIQQTWLILLPQSFFGTYQTTVTPNYHTYYQPLIKDGTANGATSNAYLTSSDVPFKTKTKCIILKYRTGTLYNQKHAVLFKLSTSQTCSLCPQVDNALHILSGCQHTQIRNMITERHNLTCRMTFKAISKIGSFGSCIVFKDIGSNERMTMQNFQIPETAESRTVPKWIFPLNCLISDFNVLFIPD
jgi:hypothetical protein